MIYWTSVVVRLVINNCPHEVFCLSITKFPLHSYKKIEAAFEGRLFTAFVLIIGLTLLF